MSIIDEIKEKYWDMRLENGKWEDQFGSKKLFADFNAEPTDEADEPKPEPIYPHVLHVDRSTWRDVLNDPQAIAVCLYGESGFTFMGLNVRLCAPDDFEGWEWISG